MKSPLVPPAFRFVPRPVGAAGWLRGVGALFAVCGVLLGCDNNSAQTDAGEAGTPAPMADEGTPAPMADAIACSPVVAADYDQSCTVDSDCVAVGEVAQCPASACDECRTGAVSKSAAAKYQVDLSAAFASHPGGSDCSCACASGAICQAGKCQAASCGTDLDAGAADARADAGPDAGSCTAPVDGSVTIVCDGGASPRDAGLE
jgi:hypothetical protein